MAADGLSNRQIAEALFVTKKTVRGAAVQAYAKLGIHSRGQLVAALADSEDAPEVLALGSTTGTRFGQERSSARASRQSLGQCRDNTGAPPDARVLACGDAPWRSLWMNRHTS